MKRKYLLIPVLLLGGSLLAACASAAAPTSAQSEANPGTPIPREEPTAGSPVESTSESSPQVSPSPTEAAVEPTDATVEEPETEYEIITLLPFDAIPYLVTAVFYGNRVFPRDRWKRV
jgi:hypothetical protein